MVQCTGHRQAELCCQKGLMLTTEQAHKIGMVDEIVPADQVEARAQEEIKTWIRIPGAFVIDHMSCIMRKPAFCLCCAVTVQLTSAFVFEKRYTMYAKSRFPHDMALIQGVQHVNTTCKIEF